MDFPSRSKTPKKIGESFPKAHKPQKHVKTLVLQAVYFFPFCFFFIICFFLICRLLSFFIFYLLIYFFCFFWLASLNLNSKTQNPNSKFQDSNSNFFKKFSQKNETVPGNFRLIQKNIKIANPRSYDFANALWHHRSIDETSDSKPLVVEGIKISNPIPQDFANALWHHRNIDKNSDSRPLVVKGIKTRSTRGYSFFFCRAKLYN